MIGYDGFKRITGTKIHVAVVKAWAGLGHADQHRPNFQFEVIDCEAQSEGRNT